jgi:hypothetical protein
MTVALHATTSGPSLSPSPGQNTSACNENGGQLAAVFSSIALPTER